jgi:hypothetical protein
MTMVHPTARAGATFPEFEVSFEARRGKKKSRTRPHILKKNIRECE